MSHRRSLLHKQPSSGLNLPLENIIHQYDFDGDSTDAIGALDGTDTNMTYGTAVGDNKSAIFDGTAYIEIPFGLRAGDATWSISFMVQSSSSVTHQRPLVLATSDGYIGFELNAASTNNFIRSWVYDGVLNYASTTSYNVTNLNHITLTLDAGTEYNLYVNGDLIDTTPQTGTISTVTPNRNVFGARRDFGLKLDGILSCVKTWSVILTDDEVNTLATAELAGIKVN